MYCTWLWFKRELKWDFCEAIRQRAWFRDLQELVEEDDGF